MATIEPWLLWTVAAQVSWGFWGFFSALAEERLDVETAFAWHCIGLAACALPAALLIGVVLPELQAGMSIVAGFAYALGALAMIESIRLGGPAGVVITITSLYPLFVIACNILILHEASKSTEMFGACLAMVAVWAMAEESESHEQKHGHTPTLWWLVYCVLAFIGFGTWTFLAEVCSTDRSLAGPSTVWQAIGCSAVCILRCPSLRSKRVKVEDAGLLETTPKSRERTESTQSVTIEGDWDVRGILYAAGMGVGMAAGTAAFMLACNSTPNKTPVVMLTGMYTLVTVLLARFILGQRLSYRRYFGIALALGASVLLSA